MDEWNAWRVRSKLDVRDEKKKRGQKLDSEKERREEKEEIEVWIDEVIQQIEEVVVE